MDFKNSIKYISFNIEVIFKFKNYIKLFVIIIDILYIRRLIDTEKLS